MAAPDFKQQLGKLVSEIKTNDAQLAAGLGSTALPVAKSADPSELPEAYLISALRPVFPIVNNEVLIQADVSEIWQDRIQNAVLDKVIPSIGRIEVQNHPMYSWVGTGWFIDRDIVVTTRDVAETFTTEHAFRKGLDGTPVRVSINMLEEEGNDQSLLFSISSVLHVEPEPGPNIAFLRVKDNGNLPLPLSLETSLANNNSNVALIGYPCRDSRIINLQVIATRFGDVFNKKHFAPGKITGVTSNSLTHDCSALGVWSGAPLADLQTGKIVGMHLGGSLFNYALPSQLIAESLSASTPKAAKVSEPEQNYGGVPERPRSTIQMESFQQGLSKAYLAAALIRDRKTKQGLSSGWLITDKLVVIPDYLAAQIATSASLRSRGLECQFIDQKNELTTVNAKIVYNPGKNKGAVIGSGCALLELEKPLTGRAAKLNMSSMQDISDIYLLHFPGGRQPMQMSISKLTGKDSRMLQYVISSTGGSGGGPLLTFDGSVIGMHLGTRGAEQFGISVRAIIEGLQKSPRWSMIAKAHNLPDPKRNLAKQKIEAAAQEREAKANEKILMKYAVRWNINPAKLTAAQKKVLKDYVIDPDNKTKWVMEDDERIKLIEKMKTLSKLREARGKERISDPAQKVIDSILQGPPYKPAKIDDEALSYWLPAITWFRTVIPKLPSLETISSELQRRKLKQRLTRSTGPDFRGRIKELKKLNNWYKDNALGAMVVSGIGGIGKSALISKFALDLGDDTLIFWLDFDRPDLAPDKALSVLKILSEQLSTQVKDYTPQQATSEEWLALANDLGDALNKFISAQRPAVIVLDGFEVAQHSKKYNEIWPLLELLLQKAPQLRIIVSGRGGVKDLQLGGKKSDSLELTGLEEEAAREWLKRHKIRSEAVINKAYSLSKGSPLILKLATRLIDEGGKIDDLQQVMVEGFLYQRIYNRVINPRLHKIVRDILVLRVISPQIIEEVLYDNLPDKMEPAKVFEEILRELSLVPEVQFSGVEAAQQTSGVTVNVRPEVRAASLKLLEFENDKRVQEIESRIIKFYKKIKNPGDAEKIELIYHYLRTNKVSEAEKLWKQEYKNSLDVNAEDIPEKYVEAKNWLNGKLGNEPLKQHTQDWEAEALDRIKDLLRRGHLTGVEGILLERNDRSVDSPLLIYDGWILARNKEQKKAIELLYVPKPKTFEMHARYFQWQILAATIAYQANDIAKTNEILASLIQATNVAVLSQYKSFGTIAIAGRIVILAREALKKEMELVELLMKGSVDVQRLMKILPLIDVISPQLQTMLSSLVPTPRVLRMPAPGSQRSFIDNLTNQRLTAATKRTAQKVKLGEASFSLSAISDEINSFIKSSGPSTKAISLAADITLLAWERWHLALSTYWFRDIMNVPISRRESIESVLALSTAVASFRGTPLEVPPEGKLRPGFSSIDKSVEFILKEFRRTASDAVLVPDPEARSLLERSMAINPSKQLPPSIMRDTVRRSLTIQRISEIEDPATRTTAFLILMPNPLEAFSRRILGLPYVFADTEYLNLKRYA